MNNMIEHYGLRVASTLSQFIENEALPGTGVDTAAFWRGFDELVHELAPKNRALLAERERLQHELDQWHRANPGPVRDSLSYRAFLERIGYLLAAPRDVKVRTTNVDLEIDEQAGPQLVVPLSNPRYALNAANARWGSLYDALYGTDTLPEDDGAARTPTYNPVRGKRVIEYARDYLARVCRGDPQAHGPGCGPAERK
jgi:malate synthase